MTRLIKPVKRRAYEPKWGEIVITLAPEGIMIREKGRRTQYGPVGYGFILQTGAKMKADERKKLRKRRRKSS